MVKIKRTYSSKKELARGSSFPNNPPHFAGSHHRRRHSSPRNRRRHSSPRNRRHSYESNWLSSIFSHYLWNTAYISILDLGSSSSPSEASESNEQPTHILYLQAPLKIFIWSMNCKQGLWWAGGCCNWVFCTLMMVLVVAGY